MAIAVGCFLPNDINLYKTKVKYFYPFCTPFFSSTPQMKRCHRIQAETANKYKSYGSKYMQQLQAPTKRSTMSPRAGAGNHHHHCLPNDGCNTMANTTTLTFSRVQQAKRLVDYIFPSPMSTLIVVVCFSKRYHFAKRSVAHETRNSLVLLKFYCNIFLR